MNADTIGSSIADGVFVRIASASNFRSNFRKEGKKSMANHPDVYDKARAAMRKQKITMNDLGMLCGVTYHTIRRTLLGEHKGEKHRDTIEKALGVKLWK